MTAPLLKPGPQANAYTGAIDIPQNTHKTATAEKPQKPAHKPL